MFHMFVLGTPKTAQNEQLCAHQRSYRKFVVL